MDTRCGFVTYAQLHGSHLGLGVRLSGTLPNAGVGKGLSDPLYHTASVRWDCGQPLP